ncbi:LCP family protein [Cohnella silvisoli]|uniref:LCP family protein n=1 Tax=Cohnella silvisoli TaxID=2873699 RepID=A0ABV1KXA4_9BACL|nr:LCP family protein [Cohnella silvisoli]MCD9023686.1 LCP family protein [Cohnella silvisoli]
MKRALMIKITIFSLISILALATLSGGYIWYSMQKTMDAMYEPLPSVAWIQPDFENEVQPSEAPASGAVSVPVMASPAPKVVVTAAVKEQAQSEIVINKEVAQRLRHPNLSAEEPFSILLLGVDERAGDRGRSDTMILLTVQPKKKSATALSIPRDTRVIMPNTGKYDKINHAYAFGGTSLAVEAVEHLFGVPIAYYMKTNMEGLVSIVDTVGGVDIDNPRKFDFVGYSFAAGPQHLNGEQALAYSRMRKEDPQGDFGRTQRQRQVLANVVDRVVSVNSITKLPRLLSHLSEFVRTNLTSQNMIDLALNYRPAINNVETLYINGQGQMIKGIYYYVVKPEERQKIQQHLLINLDPT